MFRQRITVPLIALLIFSLTVTAQRPAPTQVNAEKIDLEMMKKIRDEGMQRSQVMDTLSWLTDVHGPRLTGSPQLKGANEWTKNKLAEWGMQNAHLEAWGPFGKGWTLERFSAQVIEPTPFPLIAFPKAWTPGTNGAVTGEVVFADLKSEADFDKYRGKLKNAFVMTVPMREVVAHFKPQGARLTEEELWKMASDLPEGVGGRQYSPEILERIRKMREFAPKLAAFLKAEGVAAMLDAGRGGDGGTLFVQQDGSAMKPGEIPSVVVAIEHYGRIFRLLQKNIPVKVEMNLAVKFHGDETQMAYNTVAEIPGTDKADEIVMLGAHLDSWHGSTGATDNGAGTAVCMEALRILKTLGVQPRRTIRIGLWTGEEQGLFGSRAYVKAHFGERLPDPQKDGQQPFPGMRNSGPLALKPDHAKFAAYFNLDNGTGKVRGVYLQGNEAVRPIFRAWLEPFRDLGAATLTIDNTGGTDHLSFDAVGLPGFQFIQDEIEYETRTHHSNMDSYERIQPEDMKQAAVLMAAFVYNAAMRDEKLPRKALPAPVQQAATAPAPAPEVPKTADSKMLKEAGGKKKAATR